MAKSALLGGQLSSPFDRAGKVRSPYATSQGNQVNRGTFKLVPSTNQLESPEHQVKTKQVFFKARNARHLVDPSSPHDQKSSRFDYGKKRKRGTGISKKSKSNLMLQRQSASQANGFAERLSKASKSQMKSNPQFVADLDRFEKYNPKLVYSQAGLTENKNEYSAFISNMAAKSATHETRHLL